MTSGDQRGRLVGPRSCRVYRPQGGVGFSCDFKERLLEVFKRGKSMN